VIGLPGTNPPEGSAVLQWSDATNAQAEAARLMNQALGPMATDPVGFAFMVRKPEEVRAAQLFLQCQTNPTLKELVQFLPNSFSPRPSWLLDVNQDVKVEMVGSNSYRETMLAPFSASDYLAWGATIEPELSIIRKAVRRPYARMAGDYSFPSETPIPNFVTLRTVSQRLAALAECHLLLGQPEKALDDLTLIHLLCRVLELRPTGRPMTLVAAMINVAITQLYVDTIQDGMRMQVWQEPQLAALQEQLKEIHLRQYVVNAFAVEQAATCAFGELASPEKIMETFKPASKPIKNSKFAFFYWLFDFDRLTSPFTYYRLIPRGWVYQNIVVNANLHQIINEGLDSTNELVVPHRVAAINPTIERELAHASPFKILASIAIPNTSKAFQTMAHNQTAANQAQVACALERYRLAHGEYPATLEALTPQFIDKIPVDMVGGQPPRYHRTEDGKFLLYSIGWSEADHGGRPGTGAESDWVWGDPAW